MTFWNYVWDRQQLFLNFRDILAATPLYLQFHFTKQETFKRDQITQQGRLEAKPTAMFWWSKTAAVTEQCGKTHRPDQTTSPGSPIILYTFG